jgi:hypothetical protein
VPLDPPPLIPRRTLFGNPDRAALQVSPDGRHLSWLAPDEGVLNVFVAPRDEPSGARPVTADRGRGIRAHAWCFTSRHVVYLQDEDGDENWHVHCADLEAGQCRDLTPVPGVAARIEGLSDEHPERLVVGLNDRDARYHDLWTVELSGGQRRLLLLNEGFAGFELDAQLEPRLAARFREDGGVEYLRRDGEAWAPWLVVGSEDSLTTAPIGFDRSGRRLHALDSRGRDTAALVEIDWPSGRARVLAESDRADAGAVILDPETLRPQAVPPRVDAPRRLRRRGPDPVSGRRARRRGGHQRQP